MKIYLSLIFTAIILSFSTAYLALNLEKDFTAGKKEVQEIRALVSQFKATSKSVFDLDLQSMYPMREDLVLFRSFEKSLHKPPVQTEICNQKRLPLRTDLNDKFALWEAYRCGDIKSLPERFFELAPFMHPEGTSYAMLAWQMGHSTFTDLNWIQGHLKFFHLRELKELPVASFDERFSLLSKLTEEESELLLKGEELILVSTYLLIKDQKSNGLFYQVYNLKDFESFLQSSSYSAGAIVLGKKCFYQLGTVCFQKNTLNLLQLVRPSSIVIFTASILILLLVLLSLYSRIKGQSREEERKRHALRVLTHELRTPVANLMLLIESLNKRSDEIPPSVLEEFLRIEGEVYRLKRLAEKSSSYLHSSNEDELINFEPKTIHSFNEFLESFLESYTTAQIEFHPFAVDPKIELDAYWFGICFKNLIENAIAHGARPVTVTCLEKRDFFQIQVKDAGTFKDSNSTTRGLGLGLELVQKIMKEMKGELLKETNPTRMSLLIRKTK